MNYCSKCGCYIPVDAPECLACGKKQRSKNKSSVSVQSDILEGRRTVMKEAFEEYKKTGQPRMRNK